MLEGAPAKSQAVAANPCSATVQSDVLTKLSCPAPCGAGSDSSGSYPVHLSGKRAYVRTRSIFHSAGWTGTYINPLIVAVTPERDAKYSFVSCLMKHVGTWQHGPRHLGFDPETAFMALLGLLPSLACVSIVTT